MAGGDDPGLLRDDSASACTWSEFSDRAPSLGRKHGDPFPLPRLPPGFACEDRGRFRQLRRVDNCLRSLNTLAVANQTAANFDCAPLPLTSVQTWVMNDVAPRVALYGECPPEITEEAALAELHQRANLYQQEAGQLAPCDLSKVKILNRQLQPHDAWDLAPPEVRGYLDHSDELIVRPLVEQEALRDSGVLNEPYWDPRLRHSKVLRIELYKALHKRQLLTFRARRKARVGFFTVKKKDGMQRLIIDARQANSCHRPPPTTRLGTPAGLCSLDLSDDTLESHGFGGIMGDGDKQNVQVTAEAGDVGDCFYNFAIPSLASWFATDDHFSVEELNDLGFEVSHIYDDELGHERPVGHGERLFAVFNGVPMGWSWALYIANEIVSYQVSLSSVRPGRDEVRDRLPAPDVLPGAPVVATYVDNVHCFGGQPGDAGSRMEDIGDRFARLGIPFVIDKVESQLCLESLGLFLDFRDRATARAKSERAWKLWTATRGLLRRRRVSGRVLRVWLGLVNFHMQLFRPALSSLSATYKFAAQHLEHRAPLWPSVRQELRTVIGLLFLVEWDMSAPCCREVHIGDSSDRGFALMFTEAEPDEIRTAIRHREKWRFRPGDPCSVPARHFGFEEGADHFIGAAPEAGVGILTTYGRELAEKADREYENQLFKRRRLRVLGAPQEQTKTFIQGPSIPELDPGWDRPERWQLVTAGPWKHIHEHINIKEGRVLLMGLRRLARSRHNLGTTALSISDNLVSVLAFEKGRSGSRALNRLCRRAAAYQLACRIQWRLRHIPTGRNVSDGPSRLWGPDFTLPPWLSKQTADERNEVPKVGHFDRDSFELGDRRRDPGREADGYGGSRRCLDGLPSSGAGSACLEIFSGTGRLTAALICEGLRCYPDIEVAKGSVFNMIRPSSQRRVLDFIRAGKIWYVHLGTPCCVWSRRGTTSSTGSEPVKKKQSELPLPCLQPEWRGSASPWGWHSALRIPRAVDSGSSGPLQTSFDIQMLISSCAGGGPLTRSLRVSSQTVPPSVLCEGGVLEIINMCSYEAARQYRLKAGGSRQAGH